MSMQHSKKILHRAIIKCLATSISTIALFSFSTSTWADEGVDDLFFNSQPDGVCEVIYGVHDQDLNDTQVVTIDPANGYAVTPLGPLLVGHDIEGLDITSDGVLLMGSSGDEGNPIGALYEISTQDGSAYEVGEIGFNLPEGPYIKNREVSALSFDPDQNLWAWVEECGLIQVNLNDPANSTFMLDAAFPDLETCMDPNPQAITPIVEDITWDNTGEILYAAWGTQIWKYSNGELSRIGHEKLGGNVESIETLPEEDNALLLNVHGKAVLYSLNVETGQISTVNPDVGDYDDIEATAACVDDCVPGDTDWMYATDYIGDATSNQGLEIYGMGIKQEGDTVIVAMNANMSPNNPLIYKGKAVGLTDFVFDFSGVKYAVHFDSSNDSGADSGVGLYKDVTLKDVTKSNYGWPSFKRYSNFIKGNGDLGELPLQNNYFSWTAYWSVPQEIASGTKVDGDDFTALGESDLIAMGLDTAQMSRDGSTLGTSTFGFSFTKTDEMSGEFIAYFFTECINDGMVMTNELPACPPEGGNGNGPIDAYSGNADCPAGTEMMAKFEWSGDTYTEDGDNLGVTINGDTSGGTWSSTAAISYIIVKGGANAGGYSVDLDTEGTFSNMVIPVNGGGNVPDISNIKFCAPVE